MLVFVTPRFPGGLFVGIGTWILILGGSGGVVIESCNDADIFFWFKVIPCVVPGGRMRMLPVHGVFFLYLFMSMASQTQSGIIIGWVEKSR